MTEALELLSSEAQQLEYERTMPKVDVTPEIVCAWSSDAYHPAEPGFVAAFSHQEMDALSQFDAVFRANVEHLPPSQGTVKSWHSSTPWQAIMNAAASAHGRIAV